MRGDLAKNRKRNFKIDSRVPSQAPIVDAKMATGDRDDKVAVNLRYFERSFECLSDWQKQELKELSGWVNKMAAKTEAQITSSTRTCHAHVGRPRKLPATVSPEVKMYSLVVAPKARVHGFFSSGNFFLVWLDRTHKVLKV